MFKVAFKTFVKVMLALGAVFAALVVLQKYFDNRNDYIEIYNDAEDDEGDLF